MSSERIRQCNLSPPFKRAGKFQAFLDYYSLAKYNDPNAPAIFFGLHDFDYDIEKVLMHKSLAVLIWTGGDSLKKKHLLITRKLKHVKHIAISSFIEQDLKKWRIDYKFLPIRGNPIDAIDASPLGNEIYTYIPIKSKKKNRRRYGGDVVKALIHRCKFKINVISSTNEYKQGKLLQIYKRCFCGLRFTSHDGLSNTIVEMGLMGRRSFTNDKKFPFAISWNRKNIDEIVDNINLEAKKIGTISSDVAEAVRDYVSIGDAWLYTKFWK